jgi:hypothetical protein
MKEMKKLLLVITLMIPLFSFSQTREVEYIKPSDFSFYTEEKDSLFLDTANRSGFIINEIWKDEEGQKPHIICLPENKFILYARKRKLL